MQKILVHIDSRHDLSALLDKALYLARQFSSKVELFSCCYNRSIAQGLMFDREQKEQAEHAYVRQQEAHLEKLANTLAQQGVDVSWDVTWDRHTAEAVVRKVLRFEPDLLLQAVAHHPLGIGHMLFAPVDWQIARKCPVPVLFVKERPWGELLRMAVCVDPLHETDQSALLDRRLLDTASALAEQGFAELDIVHCFNTLPHEAIFDEHMVLDYQNLQENVQQHHRQALIKLLGGYGRTVDDPEVHLLHGETDQAITEFAKQQNTDLLILGVIARSVLDRILLGSTMERVVDQVQCDVLLIKHPSFKCPVSES
ncbi:universal stress protein [Neptuniibacter sp. CAU 1671]|uniref:universal stress protein n=1 Tax=Neptuniibacter sp. CAU 1671 TaxID=3032593 RepID=UPI0023DB8402|nr:universal stress protein [Neptuniibacter sp. CAU 1671]MDF2182872.1 universal stress protein [Neptuniibacter sp. CAU 1671]